MPSIDQIIVWIIIGLLGGSLAGLIITRERKASAFSAISVSVWSALLSAVWCSACSEFFLDSTKWHRFPEDPSDCAREPPLTEQPARRQGRRRG